MFIFDYETVQAEKSIFAVDLQFGFNQLIEQKI